MSNKHVPKCVVVMGDTAEADTRGKFDIFTSILRHIYSKVKKCECILSQLNHVTHDVQVGRKILRN